MSLSDLTLLAAETGESAPAVHPIAVGLVALGLLLLMLVGLLFFAGGREHS